MQTISIDEARRDFDDTIARVTGDRQLLGIGENGSADVVLVPATELQRLQRIAASKPEQTLFDRAGRMARLGYWEWDVVADSCADCSEELARIYGLTPEQFLARMNSLQGWYDFIHPDDRARVQQLVTDSRARNSGYDVEYRLCRDDGTVLYAREVAEPVLDDNGRVIWSMGIVQDISEQKRAERELKESEAMLRSLYAQLPGAVYRRIMQADGSAKYTFISTGMQDLVGYSAEELIADPELYPDNVHPRDRAARNRAIRHSADTLERYDAEYRFYLPNGEIVWIKAIADPERLDNGDVIWTGLSLDVTDRKRLEVELRRSRDKLEARVRERTASLESANRALEAEIAERKRMAKELRESEERYRELFDESPVAIWVEDWSLIKQMFDDLARGGVKDWRGYFDSHRDQLRTAYDLAKILEISRATIDLYRKESKEHLLQMSAGALVIDEELDAFRDIVLSFLAGRMTVDIESKDTAGDESEIIVQRRVVMPPKRRDDWTRVIYAIEDITERKQAEEQLRQAQKMEAVGQLTGGVSHDFNNLLGVIIGNAEILVEDLGDDDPSPRAILRAARRGTELTQRLLAFSRRQPLDPQTINLGGLVDDMSGMLERTLGESIEIEIVREEGLWPAMADAGQVENALLNLAINARDAMPGGGRLTIECLNARLDAASLEGRPDISPGDFAVLAVSDNGSGMPASVLEHVFEPFFTTKEVGQGTGLGLSMIYGFAKQSGGHLTIYSEEGTGTTVNLYLPRSGNNDIPCKPDDLATLPAGQGETVLLLEDDDDVRSLAARILKGLGYRVIEAAQASSAGDALAAADRVDLLLTDVVLPGKVNGPEFARQARDTHPELKILFMSGYPAEAMRRNGFADLGGAPLLRKPLDRRQLAEALHAALRD